MVGGLTMGALPNLIPPLSTPFNCLDHLHARCLTADTRMTLLPSAEERNAFWRPLGSLSGSPFVRPSQDISSLKKERLQSMKSTFLRLPETETPKAVSWLGIQNLRPAKLARKWRRSDPADQPQCGLRIVTSSCFLVIFGSPQGLPSWNVDCLPWSFGTKMSSGFWGVGRWVKWQSTVHNVDESHTMLRTSVVMHECHTSPVCETIVWELEVIRSFTTLAFQEVCPDGSNLFMRMSDAHLGNIHFDVLIVAMRWLG